MTDEKKGQGLMVSLFFSVQLTEDKEQKKVKLNFISVVFGN